MSPGRLRTITDLGDLAGRRVLVRCDFNVPLEEGRITDDLRITATAPTLVELSSRVPVVARVCGTAADPQDAPRQEAELREAGVVVAPSNAAAARLAGLALTRGPG